MDLLEKCASLIFGTRDEGLAFRGGIGHDAFALGAGLLLGVGDHQLDFDHVLGRGGLGSGLQIVDLGLGLAEQGGRTLLRLRHDPGCLLVGVPQDLRAVLAERRRQGRLVDHRMRGPLLGFGDRGLQLPFVLLERLDTAGHRLQVGAHLVGIEPAPDHGERVVGDVTGRDPRRRDGARPSGMARAYGAA